MTLLCPQRLRALTQVVQKYVDPYQRTTSMVITPTVVKEVRAQFGCDTLPGAALENEGGQGSANAHWEYRWFQVCVCGGGVEGQGFLKLSWQGGTYAIAVVLDACIVSVDAVSQEMPRSAFQCRAAWQQLVACSTEVMPLLTQLLHCIS